MPPAFHSLQLVAQAWQPTQVSRSITSPSFFFDGGGNVVIACPSGGGSRRRSAAVFRSLRRNRAARTAAGFHRPARRPCGSPPAGRTMPPARGPDRHWRSPPSRSEERRGGQGLGVVAAAE